LGFGTPPPPSYPTLGIFNDLLGIGMDISGTTYEIKNDNEINVTVPLNFTAKNLTLLVPKKNYFKSSRLTLQIKANY